MPPVLHFGLLLLPDFQWLDAVGPVDYINNHSNQVAKSLWLPEAVADKAPIMHWYYISHDLQPVQPAYGPAQVPTHTYENCPDLDYIVVPGPDPRVPLPDGCSDFLKKRFSEPKLKALLTVCSGSLAIAQTGILDGRAVCANKFVLRAFNGLALAGQEVPVEGFKNVKWVVDKRWHIDGKVWSAAGVTAGIDMAAEFARQYFDEEIVKFAQEIQEYKPQPAQPDPFAYLLEGAKFE